MDHELYALIAFYGALGGLALLTFCASLIKFQKRKAELTCKRGEQNRKLSALIQSAPIEVE